jgi:putative aldouronate transport system permease protein
MFGNILAFRKYNPGGSIFGQGPLTLKYFKQFITAKPFWQAFSNTLILNGLYLLFRFPLTLIFALLLNEIRNLHWKKFVQTVSYLPHFISVVIVCGMLKELLSTHGPINDMIFKLGGEKISFISLAEWFRTIFVTSGIWQSLGWGTILYLAAMSGINPSLYEAATVDGATHFQQVIHVTIPCILPTIATLLILDIGGLVGSGGAFEKVYLLYSPMTYETSDIVSTYVFRMGVESGSINFATAVGLFEGLINLVLLTCANFVSRKVAKTSLW